MKKEQSKKKSKNFNKKSSKFSKSNNKNNKENRNGFLDFSDFENKKIEEIFSFREGNFEIIVEITRVFQTSGPTVFAVSDGTGSLQLKGFIEAGVRAYPEIGEGDCVKAQIKLGEFNGELEGSIVKIKKLDDLEKEGFLDSLKRLQEEKAKITPPNFLVKSKILDKLKDSLTEAAMQIRLAIIQDRPIIVRHHNDTDGYSSGYTLEKAILPLIQKQHSSEKASWEFFTRAPCTAPFYEIDDSIRDTALSLRNAAKFSNKMPLIIIADNGSSPEDLMAIKQGKIHGADFIVVDHHFSKEDVISDQVLVHVNPFLVGEEKDNFSAGMICTELARFINPDVKNIKQIPAMAGFADKIHFHNPSVMEEYLKIAIDEGYTKELLSNISLVIEYVSSKVRFMEVREYIEVLFGEPRMKQKELIDLLAPHIKKLDKKGLDMGKVNAQKEKVGDVNFQMLHFEEFFPGFGFFPKPGRVVALVHDDLNDELAKKENKGVKLITIGVLSTAVTMRATDESNFSVHDLISFLNEKVPDAFVEGGGHKNAGSISFLPNKQEEIVYLIREFIKERN